MFSSKLARTIYKSSHKCANVVSRNFTSDMLAMVAVVGISPLLYAVGFYKVANPNEHIIVTGPLLKLSNTVDDMQISKTALILPFQKYKFVNVQAINVSTIVPAITMEKIPFKMPVSFTLCPNDGSPNELSIYTKKFGNMNTDEINDTISSVVIGETRLLTGAMGVEDIFGNRKAFKEQITERIQECLEVFGIKVDNVNVGELSDDSGSDYFKNLSVRALQQAHRDADVSTEEHARNADSEKKEFESTNRKRVAGIEASIVSQENDAEENIIESKTKLAIYKAAQDRSAVMANLEATAETERRKFDLQLEVEQKRKEQMIEQQRADNLSKAIVDKDALIVETEAAAAKLKISADASAYEIKIKADAALYAQEQEAKGILEIEVAKAQGLMRNIDAAGGDVNRLVSYIMANSEQHVKIAEKCADGVKDMKPIVFTKSGNGDDVSDVLGNLGGTVAAFSEMYKNKYGVGLTDVIKSITANNNQHERIEPNEPNKKTGKFSKSSFNEPH